MLRILRRPDVEAITGLKRTRLDDLERRGEFPKRVRISDRATGWRSDEVEAWVAALPLAETAPPDSGESLARGRASMRRARAADAA